MEKISFLQWCAAIGFPPSILNMEQTRSLRAAWRDRELRGTLLNAAQERRWEALDLAAQALAEESAGRSIIA